MSKIMDTLFWLWSINVDFYKEWRENYKKKWGKSQIILSIVVNPLTTNSVFSSAFTELILDRIDFIEINLIRIDFKVIKVIYVL